MKKAVTVTEKLGVKVITGFTGSLLWHCLYSFTQTPESMVEAGFKKIREGSFSLSIGTSETAFAPSDFFFKDPKAASVASGTPVVNPILWDVLLP